MTKEKLEKLFIYACEHSDLFQMKHSPNGTFFEVTFIRPDAETGIKTNFDIGIAKIDKAVYNLYFRYISYNVWMEKEKVEFPITIDKEDFNNLQTFYKKNHERKLIEFIPEIK